MRLINSFKFTGLPLKYVFPIKKNENLYNLEGFEIWRFSNEDPSVVPTTKHLVPVATCLAGQRPVGQNTEDMDRKLQTVEVREVSLCIAEMFTFELQL